MTTAGALRVLALSLAASQASVPAIAAQSLEPAGAARQIVNGNVEMRASLGSLDKDIEAVRSRGGAAWIAYRIPTGTGPRGMCAHYSQSGLARVLLEPATEITVLGRVDSGGLSRIEQATPDCAVDAGGLPVVWLTGVSTDESARWLTAVISTSAARARVGEQAIAALTWHPGNQALQTLVGLARQDARTSVRGKALFWLSQRAGQEAVRAIRDAVNDDPETEVKLKAVFALSRLPADQGIPLLIQTARSNQNREVRRQAMFWLGQSNDRRAIDFFEAVLTSR